MKADAAFIEQIRAEAGGAAADAMKRMGAAVMTAYHTEHEADDRHSTIHATGAIYERGRTAAIGETIPVFFKPSNFTANGSMTWTVTTAAVNYSMYGPRMLVEFEISASVIGGVLNTALFIAIPSGLFAVRNTYNPCRVVDNAVPAAGVALVVPAGRVIQIFRNDVAAWTATPIVQGQLMFEVRTA